MNTYRVMYIPEYNSFSVYEKSQVFLHCSLHQSEFKRYLASVKCNIPIDSIIWKPETDWLSTSLIAEGESMSSIKVKEIHYVARGGQHIDGTIDEFVQECHNSKHPGVLHINHNQVEYNPNRTIEMLKHQLLKTGPFSEVGPGQYATVNLSRLKQILDKLHSEEWGDALSELEELLTTLGATQ